MKRGLLIGIGILLLLAGCSGKQEDVADQNIDDVVSEAEVSENEVSDNEVSDNETSGNGLFQVALPEGYAAGSSRHIEQDEVLNVEEVLEYLRSNNGNIQWEITVEEGYVEGVPTELQDLLIYRYDGVTDERDEYWKEYEAECEEISAEDIEDAPEYMQGRDLQIIDIDGDGENEYFWYVSNGTAGRYYIEICKYINGRWKYSAVGNSYHIAVLYYEDRYYILCDNVLVWWNDETDLEEFGRERDLIDRDLCWSRLVLGGTSRPTGYTPHEVYSNTPDDSIDFLENINWETLEDIDAWKTEYENIWEFSDGSDIAPRYGWERQYDGERYLYVILSDYDRIHDISSDRVLLIMRRTEGEMWEIVKEYYLAGDYYEYLFMSDRQ